MIHTFSFSSRVSTSLSFCLLLSLSIWRRNGVAALHVLERQDGTAQCITNNTYLWLRPPYSDSPCDLFTSLTSLCPENGDLRLTPLGSPKTEYSPPAVQSLCTCSLAAYNLMAACSYCQGFEYLNHEDYSSNCTNITAHLYNLPEKAWPTWLEFETNEADKWDLNTAYRSVMEFQRPLNGTTSSPTPSSTSGSSAPTSTDNPGESYHTRLLHKITVIALAAAIVPVLIGVVVICVFRPQRVTSAFQRVFFPSKYKFHKVDFVEITIMNTSMDMTFFVSMVDKETGKPQPDKRGNILDYEIIRPNFRKLVYLDPRSKYCFVIRCGKDDVVDYRRFIRDEDYDLVNFFS